MDTVTATQMADILGVALPTVHGIFDRAGIETVGRGRVRVAPTAVLAQAIRERGAVTAKINGLSRSEMLALAGLSRSPVGIVSARQLARKVGISPTVASRDLRKLEQLGLVEQRERVIAAGRASRQKYWALNRLSQGWSGDLKQAVRRVTLPDTANDESAPQATTIPTRLQHLFWNADLGKVSVKADGSYVAGRLLAAPDLAAGVWALKHLRPEDVHLALTRRGVDERTRAFVSNWENYEAAAMQ